MGHGRKIAVIGLGYVGLPLAVAFGQKSQVIGFDINPKRIEQLKTGLDATYELDYVALSQAEILFTYTKDDLKSSDFYIVTVPTPLDEANKPDLTHLENACQIIGQQLKPGDIVVFESTVYPGTTQEICIPWLEHYSHLKAGVEFTVGYSPERLNPGDKIHTLVNVPKIVAGLDDQALDTIAKVYETIITAGVYKASSIKVAEAAKILENTQRDLNIALMNECAIIFDTMHIDTSDVLNAAKTKWNFLPFYPGLVGGHCIGVAPYYFTYKAKQLGYRPEVILAGRRINDGMGKYIANQTVKKLILAGSTIKDARVLILGLTFKENCHDLRDSKVIDVINELRSFAIQIEVHDPIAEKKQALEEYGIELKDWDDIKPANAIIVCVGHDYYKTLNIGEYAEKLDQNRIIMDVKSILNKDSLVQNNFQVWRL